MGKSFDVFITCIKPNVNGLASASTLELEQDRMAKEIEKRAKQQVFSLVMEINGLKDPK